MPPDPVLARLATLAERFALDRVAVERFAMLLALVADEPSAITTVRDPAEGVDLHVADSLVALEVDEVRAARRIADLGAGGGFPGLALAIALPQAHVALVESVGRKTAFLDRAAAELALDNVEIVNGRAEDWRPGLAEHDLVTARAVAPLPVLVEYAAPLLRIGGALVAWKGRRDPGEEADAVVAAAILGMETPEPRRVEPFPAAVDRHLYLSLKVASTPNGYPRRAGMARKRPITASGRR
jgi:16S rRNA (guanine527-N7)-methyltransferase